MANARSRYLRQHMTPQEVKLWIHLRAWRASGFHFRRQVPINGYVVDFACLKHRLVIELDAGGHSRHAQAITDSKRDTHLAASGFHVLRIWNHEIDTNLQGVLDTVHATLKTAHPTPALRADPPRSGEGSEPLVNRG